MMDKSARINCAVRLFLGEIPEDMIFPYPILGAGERPVVRRLLGELRALAPSVDSSKIDEERRIPPVLLRELGRIGLFGLGIPTAYGGRGLSNGASCRVIQELSAIDASLAVTVLSHEALGAKAILLFGTEEQRRRYLPALAHGERICAFAQAEPQSGSDAGAIRTRARPVVIPGNNHGEGRAGFALSGTKLWVSGGGVSDLFVVFAQSEVHREGAKVDRITGFLVEPQASLRRGAEERKLGVRGASTTALYLDDVMVEREQVLDVVGGGFKVLMETMNSARLGIAAACIGQAREIVRQSILHATNRRQFKRLLSTFGMIKDKCAQMQIDLYAAESMLYLTCGLIDKESRLHPALSHGRVAAHGEAHDAASEFSLESACCKVFCSEMLFRVATEAMNLVAGAAYMSDYPYERYLRDSRFFSFFGGTPEILRCYIALTGMQAPGEHLAKLSDAIKHPLRGYGVVMEKLLGQVMVAASGGPAMTRHHQRLKKEAVAIEDTVEALQRGVERVLRKHGRQISEMQYVQRRVADVTIDLYAMLACISRCSAALSAHDERLRAGVGAEAAGKIDRAERELRLCRGFCMKATSRIRKVLERFNENDDELMKAIAEDGYHGEPYPFDALLPD